MLKRIAAVLTVLIVVSITPVSAQDDRSVFWERWDVNIDNVDTSDNQFDVVEIYDVSFEGRFTFGSRVIPTERLSDITNVQVSEAGRTLQQNCSQQPGTYCVRDAGNEVSISYYFFQPLINETERFEIAYTVEGALRAYEGGDQLWWDAIPEEHFGFGIGSSTITVELPAGFAPREGVDPVVTYGAPSEVQVNGTTVVATATRQIGGNEMFSIRVQYPHDPNLAAPSWQQDFDQTREFEENVLPLLNLGIIALSILVGVGGVLLLYTLYVRRGRDPKIGPVPTYLSEPPSDLPPAVVGSLVDERADPRDVISTIIDLAHRGYLVIEEEKKEGFFGLGGGSEFTFKRTDKDLAGLREYEIKMMDKLFTSGRMERSMDSLKNKFYTVIAQIQNDLYKELVAEGLFASSPNTTRSIWAGIGVVILALAAISGGILAPIFAESSGLFLLLPIAFGVVGLTALIIAPNMPAKTLKGAEEAAKWKAFYEYLSNLGKYATLEEGAAQFERYLPYAVAFGLDKEWINTFKRVEYVPIPTWYFPTYIGPYRRGYIAGTPLSTRGMSDVGLPGDLARAGGGGFSLDQVSGDIAGGLESISSGLSNMLDSASRTMMSRPQSASSGSSGSWRSGGSSFSGGGFSGGGGSGGGSSGFG